MSKKKASAKEPFLPFFVGDFAAATAEWEGESISLYATLLMHQWALGSIPADPKRICKLVRWDWELFQVHWKTARRKFTAVTVEIDGEPEPRLINSRLEQHRAKTQQLAGKNAQAGKKGAAARWGKDGERHADDMANAIENDGTRHENANGETGRSDGERHANRHPSANGARHPKIDGAADSNPSHPIPSHPNPDISSQDLSGAVLSDQQESRCAANAEGDHGREKSRDPAPSPPRQPTPAGAMAIALRDARVQVTSIDPTLLSWIADGITTEELLEAVAVAKLRKPREVIPANYLDPIVRELRGKAAAPAANGKPRKYRTADEVEDDEITRAIADGRTDEEIARELSHVPITRIRAKREEVEHAQH